MPPNTPGRHRASPGSFAAPGDYPAEPPLPYTHQVFIRNASQARDPYLHGTFMESLPQNNELIIPGAMYL
ncbi:hypothetical protein CDD81_6222 [Ophiocordyceps australis]|uniref:Uncharacterized protein n=1 Tax=Ophiocordyceps australis TaxID=1399860 RepID=A0A2C5Y8G2_9HYPO|nr:hypothetical protein CDD81_6222 [Ophiocordyceps australis]